MYQAESEGGTLEISDEASIAPITVAKRYRRQPLQSGAEDIACALEQSVVEDNPLMSALDSAPPSVPAAQSDSQVVSTPAPACSPLQILDGVAETTDADADEQKLDSQNLAPLHLRNFCLRLNHFLLLLGMRPFLLCILLVGYLLVP